MGDDDNQWCDLGFAEQAVVFKGPTQTARVLSEGWVAARMFCPGCGADRLEPFPNNAPVADFACLACAEEYELKAKRVPSPLAGEGGMRSMTDEGSRRGRPMHGSAGHR